MLKPQFKNITPVNGFDSTNPDNAKQNSYAWSMAELGNYLYVGTARNVLFAVLSSGIFGDLPIPPIIIPEQIDMNAEIWRYKKDGSEDWERVFKSTPQLGITGFRFMIVYTTPTGETALYAAGSNRDGVVILKTINGQDWEALPAGTGAGTTTRSMVAHQGRLYMAVLPPNEIVNINTMLFTSDDPEKNGWLPVDLAGEADKNPRGNIVSMLSFNNHLYVGTGLPTGFELWRTTGLEPELNQWKLVVDLGAGDALNQFPGSLNVFGKYIYIGTASFAIRSVGPEQNLIPPKGFDLVRVTKCDKWELVVGGPPISPTCPTTGQRNKALSGFPSGFGNITNAYCWQIQGQGKNLFIGSFDWSVVLAEIIPLLLEQNGDALADYNIPNLIKSIKNYLLFLILASKFSLVDAYSSIAESEVLTNLLGPLLNIFENNLGFDMWKSRDGVHWLPISFDGFNNRYNYGVRNLFLSTSGDLYLGTANPFLGCQVWVKKAQKRS